eukprot:TRINITY_DN50075_c0_g1_i1.p1 TRINITY_DN50075_c0_g1~~TRINITY_DN50075_c0_g1_i1.p1  ORF type:complete len:820 (-),score=177.20 TRINITY_DN50075_c0_g1_i1:48-2507(-)
MGVLSVPINEEIMALATWRAVLQHALARGEVMDEVNAVTALHRAAKLYREDDGRTPVEEVHRSEGLRYLVDLTLHFASRCRPQQIANAIWSLAVLSYQCAELLQVLCDFAVQRLSSFTPQNVSNTVWALATLGFQHEALLSLIPRHVEASVREYSPQDLANTCWAFARLQRPCDEIFRLIVTESLVQLRDFQPQNMSNLVWACATLMFKDDAAMQRIASAASQRVEEFGTQELSNLTWGLATLALCCEDWLERSGAEMARRSRECCPQDLSNTLWAYGTLKHKRNEHVRAINWEVMRQIEWFSPQGLSNVIWGLSAIEYRDMKALVCISEEVMRRPLEQLTPPDISTLLYSFAVLAWMHDGALAKLRKAVRMKMPQFATRDIANVSWAMVTLSHRDDGIFRMLMAKAEQTMTDFTVTGLCNIAWAFVRFGLEVPAGVAYGIAEETVKRRSELYEEPGDAVLLSDAVCSEWARHVPAALYNECDAIGREPYDEVLTFMQDWSNIPGMSCDLGEAERYQSQVTGFKTIQLGTRMSHEILRRFGLLEECQDLVLPLRRMREEWLRKGIQTAWEEDPTDATMQHKTTCTWKLSFADGVGNICDGAEIVASGTPMKEEIRFVPCVVEHPRSNDAEFQVVNKAAERLLEAQARGQPLHGATLRMDVSEIPCLSCLGALRQFQKAFPAVKLCVSFSIRKVIEVCQDRSMDTTEVRPPPRQITDLPPPSPQEVLDNRGRGRVPPPPVAPASTARVRTKWRVPPRAGAAAPTPEQPLQSSLLAAPRSGRAKLPDMLLEPSKDDLDEFFASQVHLPCQTCPNGRTQSFY